jgi:hypothetical protein
VVLDNCRNLVVELRLLGLKRRLVIGLAGLRRGLIIARQRGQGLRVVYHCVVALRGVGLD